MAADDASVVVSLRANLKDYEAALKSAVRSTEKAAAAAEKAVSGIGKRANFKVIQNDTAAAGRSLGAMQADAKNLTFQLNDITQGLLGGQSPFQVMIQQGSQVSQVLTGAGGITQGLKLVGSSFLGLLNPVSLLTSAFIFALGYAVQYFTGVDKEGKKATDTVGKHIDALKGIADTYGLLSPEAEEVLQKFLRWREIQSVITELQAGIDALRTENVTRLNQQLSGIDTIKANLADQLGLSEANAAVVGVRQAWVTLTSDIDAGRTPIAAATALLAELDAIELAHPGAGAKALADVLRDQVIPALKGSNEAQKAALELMKKLETATGDTVEKQKAYAKALAELRQIAMPAMTEVEKLWTAYGEAIKNATTDLERHNAELALTAGLTKLEADAVADVVGGGAAAFIKKEEGFRTKAYWDVNAWRVGFGSDKYVDEMGKVQDVTKDTVVTLDQANQDLARRIGEFQQTIQRQIGPDMWRSFSEDQQAALTSIAYNYGNLPPSIVAAIEKGDAGRVAKAIAALSINPERRKREAELFGGAGFSTAEEKKNYDELVVSINEKLAAQERENAINADSTTTVDEKTAALQREKAAQEAARVEQELNNAAIAQGLPLTDELKAKNHELAVAYGAAGLAADQLATKQKEAARSAQEQAQAAKQFSQQIASMAQSAIGGLINDLRNGVDAGEAFNNMLNRILDSLIQMSLQAIFSPAGGGGLGGILGGLFGAPAAAKGGIVGQTSFPRRMVDPRVFIGAPHFARGGLVGGEVPIIAHQGEMIIPKAMVGRGGAGTTNVNNSNMRLRIDMGRDVVAADTESAKAWGDNLRRLIQVEMVRESRPGGLLRRTGGRG
jgi:GH24 family phage-related lysozyme (muramidase)